MLRNKKSLRKRILLTSLLIWLYDWYLIKRSIGFKVEHPLIKHNIVVECRKRYFMLAGCDKMRCFSDHLLPENVFLPWFASELLFN